MLFNNSKTYVRIIVDGNESLFDEYGSCRTYTYMVQSINAN